MALKQIDGPRLTPASGKPPERLVVLLHGYGADGNDLIGLAQHWRRLLPTTLFVAPHAPEPCEQSPHGYQWFSIRSFDERERLEGARKAAPVLESFLDRELARHGLPPDRLALVGFSQGTLMALHVGLRREVAPAGIVGYSGALAGAASLKAEARCRPPIVLVHGDRDTMIPVSSLFATANALAEAGLGAEWHISRGVAHSIDPEGLQIGGNFLALTLAGRIKPSPAPIEVNLA